MSSVGGDQPPCPDPSAHQKQNKLSEAASTAALYATHPERNTNPPQVLNPDGKLSAKSAATSLKYAQPQDLPSFPSVGIDTANSAGQAAMLAKDYKMKELWQPELSAAGSKAALLAAKDGGKLDLWQPTASAEGNSAAKLAMKNESLSPQLDYGYTKDGRSNALLAATQSQRNGRSRADSTPVVAPAAYPDSVNSAQNALRAATLSHKAAIKSGNPNVPDGWDSPAMQAARIQNIGDHLPREMFTEHPPVEIERQEQRDKHALRASAISMAKQMYDAQNISAAQSSTGVEGKSLRTTSTGTDIKQEAMRYIHLQDAAHKLAQERLAKVDKNFEEMRYREYYGYNTSLQKSRLSMGSFLRKGGSNNADRDELDSDDDEQQARRVRNQMSQFNTALASVDAQKQQQTDRDALLAIAQQRVQKSMLDMDARIFQDTGKVSQAMMDEWEAKAKQRATSNAEKREVKSGKTHIGGGKYMDANEIEAIAQARLKPTLEEIDRNAEARRARDAEIAREKEQQEMIKQSEKQRQKESKEEWKRFKEHEKAVTKREKEERKEERKHAAEKEPEKHHSGLLSKLSVKRKSRETSKHEAEEVAASAAAGATLAEVAEKVKDDHETTPDVATSSKVAASPLSTSATRADESVIPVTSTQEEKRATVTTPANHSTTEAKTTLPDDTTHAQTEDDTHTKSKGIKGLFSKLRHRKDEDSTTTVPVVGSASVADKQHDKEIAPTPPVVASTVTEPPTLPEHVGTDGVIGDSTHVSGIGGNPGAISPSSFKRHADADDADVSSLSSGVVEDDFKNGSTGRAVRATKAKDLPTLAHRAEVSALPLGPSDGEQKDVDEEDDETYEEARDRIEAPSVAEPAALHQKDAIHHGRETKFQEDL